MRIVFKIGLALALTYALLVAGLAVAMRQPPNTFGALMARLPPVAFMILPFERLWMQARAGHLEVHQQAPEFALRDLNSAEIVRLSYFRYRKPVVLIFGSYT